MPKGTRWLVLMCCMCAPGCEQEDSKLPPPATGGVVRDGGGDEPDAETPQLDCRTSTSAQDADRDGFSPDRGDCDDCEPGVNPGAFDLPTNHIDEDCDGIAAPTPVPCDFEIDPESTDPEDAARALGLCQFPTRSSLAWGVLEARWVRLNGDEELEDPLQTWAPEAFGVVTPHEGGRVFVMSTGVARDPSSSDYTPECDAFSSTLEASSWTNGSPPPDNYPKESSTCQAMSPSALAFNDVALEVELRVPTNANSLAFDSMFFTYEYPDFVCTAFNDFLVVFSARAPQDFEDDEDDNVLYDDQDNPIGVNSGLLSVCRETSRSARDIECELGPDLLEGTGFDRDEASCAADLTQQEDLGGASTGWLRTNVPVRPGDRLTLRFLLWDNGDPLLDSTAIIDNLTWSLDEIAEPNTGPVTSG